MKINKYMLNQQKNGQKMWQSNIEKKTNKDEIHMKMSSLLIKGIQINTIGR